MTLRFSSRNVFIHFLKGAANDLFSFREASMASLGVSRHETTKQQLTHRITPISTSPDIISHTQSVLASNMLLTVKEIVFRNDVIFSPLHKFLRQLTGGARRPEDGVRHSFVISGYLLLSLQFHYDPVM